MVAHPGPRPLPPVFPTEAASRLVLALTALDDQLEASRLTTDDALADAIPGFEGQIRTEVEAGCVDALQRLAQLRDAIADQLTALAAAQTASVRAREAHTRSLAVWERELEGWQDARRAS